MLFGLPDCDKVFMKYFDRWYSQEDRDRKQFPATRPDALEWAEAKGLSAKEVSPLTEEGWLEAEGMVSAMIDAAREDWPSYLPISLPIDLAWIDRFDKHYDQRRVKALLKSSDPTDFSNDLLVTCCEFGAVLGEVMLSMDPNLRWAYDWPYWESAIFDARTGYMVYVFHWAIKKFSSYGIDDGFEGKVLACLQVMSGEN